MNQFQKVFLERGFGLFHCNILLDEVYDKEDIYSNKVEYRNFIKGCNRIYDPGEDLTEITLTQYEFMKNDTLVIIAKLLKKVEVKTKKGLETISATKNFEQSRKKFPFVLLEIEYKNEIQKLTLFFEGNIVEPLEINVSTNLAKKIEEVIEIPEIITSHSLGESLVNIKFKNLPDEYDKVEVVLYDCNNDVLGVFNPQDGMRFVAITNLAFDKYKYQIVVKKDEEIICESRFIDFTLNRPNYSGKPIR